MFNRLSMAALAIAVPFAMACGENDDAAQQDVLRIEISLKEFAFQPEVIRIPAGRPVTLVIKNNGAIPHEFMAGRRAEDGRFEQNLIDGLQVDMMTGEMAEDHGLAGVGDDAEDDHAGGGDEDNDHGTMIMAAASETVTMSFTLPESLRGTWNMACFLPGHYEAGMRGTLIVE